MKHFRKRQSAHAANDASAYSRDAYTAHGRSADADWDATPYADTGSDVSKTADFAPVSFDAPVANSAGGYDRAGGKYTHAAAVKPRRHRVLKAFLIVLVLLLATGGVAAALYLNNINSLLSGNLSNDERAKIDEALMGSTDFDEPFYMMLIGSDERTGDESMGHRSDTNILVRVDAKAGKVTMVSIPRDTAINYGDYGTVKFNAAYAYDGAAGTIKAANQLCGVKISHYASVNFDGLTDLVDAVGGVDVEVPELIDDPDAGDIVIKEGKQHLNGAAALVFARSRAYVDGDYTRVANQRALVEAVAQKAMQQNPADLSGTVTAAAKNVTTDFSAQDLISLALTLKSADELTIYSATLPSTTGTVGGASYVFADVPGIQVLMKAVDKGEDPSSKKMQKAIAAAGQAVAGYGSTSSSSSSKAGGNAVTEQSLSGGYDSSTGYDSTSGYDPNYNYGYGIDTATGSNVSGGNYGAVDDE